MKKNFLFIIAVMSFMLFNSCGVTDDRESKAHDYLQQKISDESGNALKLENFTKTNGMEQDMMGMKLYVLEWQVQISVQKEFWELGGPGGLLHHADWFWGGFNVMAEKPDHNAAMVEGERHFNIGTNIHFTGNCKFQKTEQGWRVESYHINSWEILTKK